MTEVAALPPLVPLASLPPPPACDAAQPSSPGRALTRLPVCLRHTASSRSHALVDPESETAGEIRALMRREHVPPAGRLPQLGTGGAAEYVRHGGEDLRELVARKRQIFLAQMSLDIKHNEIAKLEQRAHQREEALLAAEQALEQDSQRFEEYLKENDAKLQEALRAAEAAARARAEKAAEAKRLAASIAGIRAEMAKIEEQLQECQRLKAFLDSVTPEEWFQSLAATRDAKKAALRAEWRAACDALAAHKEAAAAAKQRAEHEMQWARTQQQWERAERAAREAAAASREAMAQQDPPEPDQSTVDREEEPAYFQDPTQLLEVFSQLEASNMFQIAAAQEAEAATEAARAAHAATQMRLDLEAGVLRRQVEELEDAIASSRARSAALRAAEQQDLQGGASLSGSAAAPSTTTSSSDSSSDSGAQAQDQQAEAVGPAQGAAGAAAALFHHLAAAYQAAGFAPDASVTPLQMLQKMEAALEEWLAAFGPPGSQGALAAEAVERVREKERRQAARAIKLAARLAEHEARTQRVLERAAAPRFQKQGKPAMTRSVLQRQEAAADSSRQSIEQDELAAYLARIDATFGCWELQA